MHTLAQLSERLNGYAATHPFPAEPQGLYDPCTYIMRLGGKRLRPALALMGYELFGQNLDEVLPAAWAVELFHNFTLIHDDIMDAAPLRRGQATVHTQWNVNTGILSGDVMLIFAYRHLCSTPHADIVPEILQVFNRVATEVCEGQQMDVDFESREDVRLQEYTRMIELKTAVLLGGALEIGARCARASEEDAGLLYQFGRLAGISFQIQDDYLDSFGDPAKFGKQVGGDILQNKKTFLVLKTLETAPASERSALLDWMRRPSDNPEEKIASVKAIFTRNYVPEQVLAAQDQYRDEAFACLDRVQAPAERKAVLRQFVEDLLVREF